MTRRSVVFGMSGSGKSNTATMLIEQCLDAGEQVVLIDPKGEGWGLQSSADGKSPGFDIIVFGHERGDIPELQEQHAEQIADFVIESGRSVVLSLQDMESDQAERRFVTRFFKRLYRGKVQQPTKTRMLVVLEEAHLFVPEKASGPTGDMVGAIKRIARQGRAAGIGLMVVEHRPAEVAKSIITQSELLICHQLVHKLDRDALRDWVRAYDTEGQGEEFMKTLATLAPGEAWVWSPGWLHLFDRAKVDRRITFDSGATPDGSAHAAPKTRAKVDLQALRAHLAQIVAESAATDPKKLQERVKELESELSKARTATTTREIMVITPEQEKALAKVAAGFSLAQNTITEEIAKLMDFLREPYQTVSCLQGFMSAHRNKPQVPQPSAVVPKTIPVNHAPIRISGVGTARLAKAERKILTVLAQFPDGCTKRKLALIAVYSINGGGFNNALSSLRTQGLIEGSDPLRITEPGCEALGEYVPLPTGPDLLSYWLGQLGKAERLILEKLAEAYPSPMEKIDLAAALDYAPDGGGFNNALSRLRTLELITGSGSQPLIASHELF